jgi:hypothetical protein
MTYSVVHQCPKCELRFSFRSELEHHLRSDHPAPASVERAMVDVATVPAATALLVAPAAAASARRARRQLPVVSLFLVLAAVLLVTCAAMFLSLSATVMITVAVLLLVGMYGRRSRGWPRVPHR